MIDSPIFRELIAKTRLETARSALQIALGARFDEVPPETAAAVEAVEERERLIELLKWCAVCPSLESFQERLP